MKLTLHDCYALLRERLEIIELLTAVKTPEFWQEMIELTKEGLERAKEHQALVEKQMVQSKKAEK